MIRRLISLSIALIFLFIAVLPMNVFAADYTQGVDVAGSNATIWFKSNVSTTWVDVHYNINSGAPVNVRMTYNNTTARYEQAGITVANGDLISYNFTYNNGTPAYDTPVFTYTVASSTPTPTPTSTPTPTAAPTPTATPTPNTTPTPTPSATATPTPTPNATATPTPPAVNLALNKPVTVSSTENVGTPGSSAVDGNTTTRWSSAYSDPQWLYVDLGSTQNIGRVSINWEAAYAISYKVQVSNDTSNWNDIYSTTSGDGGIDDLSVSGSGRYVRLYCTQRALTLYGYSVYEFEVYNSGGGATPTPTPTPAATPTPGPAGKVIPGLVEAESYDAMSGVQLEACGEGGQDVGWIDTGDYMDYNVTVQTAGTYTVEYRVSSPYDTGKIDFKSGSTTLATTSVPNTGGWQTFTSVTAAVNLSAGAQTIRIYANNGGWNLNYIKFSSATAVNIPVTGPYVQYLEIGLNPTDLNSAASIKTQNTNINSTIKYYTGTVVTLSVSYMVEQKQVLFVTTDQNNNQISGNPLTFTVNPNSAVTVNVISQTPTPGPSTTPTPTPTQAPTPTPTPIPAAFNLISPINGQMVTSTRTPTLSWQAKSGAVKYEVWVNTSRTDYDWNASGNLLDRYTKVTEVTGTSCTAPSLVDRWTYKWYVVAVDGSGGKSQSNIGQFSVYLPYLEQMADGVNIVNGCRDCNKDGTIQPYEDWHLPISTRVDDLMSRMTNDEKLHQLFYSPDTIDAMDVQAGFVYSYGVMDFIQNAQIKVAQTQRLGIPIGFLGDMIDGWKTAYPTELGLAATRNFDTILKCGDLQRREQKAGGFTGTLAPLAEVDTKVLYPRFQEGTGENADFSAAMLRALICGMQGGPEVNPKSMLITVKHWPSQGAGGEQSIVYDATTIKWHMKTWYAALDANCGSIMPGYGNSSFLDPQGTGAGSSKPTIDYLRYNLGYNGMVVTDWLASSTDDSVNCLGAGCDVMGGAAASGTDFNTLINSVGWTRLNEAVRRVLDLKFRLGMFENPYADPDYPQSIWQSTDSQSIVNNAAKQSLTLLKNNGILPLSPKSGDTIVVGGPLATADNASNYANVIWSSIYSVTSTTKSYYQAIVDRAGAGVNVPLENASSAKAAVVVLGEHSYTHGYEWPENQITFPADQLAEIDKYYNAGIPVIAVVVMPRPYVLTDILNKCAAIVVVYRPGNGGGLATSQLLFGDYMPQGKLPFQLPRSADQVGTNVITNQLEKWDIPYDLGATDAQRTQIRSYIDANQTVPTTFGDPLYPYGYGLQNFTPSP